MCDSTTTTVIAGHPEGIDRADPQPTVLVTPRVGERGNDVSAVRRLEGGSRPSQSRGGVGITARRYRATTCFEGTARCHSRGAADHVAARRRRGHARGSRRTAGRNGGAGDAGRRQRLFRRVGRRRPAHRRGRGGSDPNRRLARAARSHRFHPMPSATYRWSIPCRCRPFPDGQAHPWARRRRCCARSGCRRDRNTSVGWRLAAAEARSDRAGTGRWRGAQRGQRRHATGAKCVCASGRHSPATEAMTGPFYLVTDSGVLFGMHDENTAKRPRRPRRSRFGALAGAVTAASRTGTEQGQCVSRARQCSRAAVTGRPRPSSPPRQPRRRRRSRHRRMRYVAGLDLAGFACRTGDGRSSSRGASTRLMRGGGVTADRGQRVDDTVTDERIPAAGRPMRGVLDSLHHLSRGQVR